MLKISQSLKSHNETERIFNNKVVTLIMLAFPNTNCVERHNGQCVHITMISKTLSKLNCIHEGKPYQLDRNFVQYLNHNIEFHIEYRSF